MDQNKSFKVISSTSGNTLDKFRYDENSNRKLPNKSKVAYNDSFGLKNMSLNSAAVKRQPINELSKSSEKS